MFDISPFRTSYYAKRNAPIMTHEDNILKFYDDILNLKYEHDLHLVIKIKRLKFSKFISKKYINFLKKLEKFDDITLLDESFSVNSIVSSCNLIVCSPFTSPGVLANISSKNVFIMICPHVIIDCHLLMEMF